MVLNMAWFSNWGSFKTFSSSQVVETVHVGANKLINSVSIIQNYKTNISSLKENHDFLKTTNMEQLEKLNIPLPRIVKPFILA